MFFQGIRFYNVTGYQPLGLKENHTSDAIVGNN